MAGFLTVCDDRSTHPEETSSSEAQRHAELQAQLQTEQAKRLEAEKAAEVTKSSRAIWIIGLVAAGCVVCLVALLIGVHIGSRPTKRTREGP
jgi:hypothetical protein